MALSGEIQRSCATLLTTTEVVDQDPNFLQDPITNDCCYNLIAFVNEADTTDEITNDKYHYNFRYDQDLVTSATMTLQTFTNGSWVDVASLVNDTYGTFEPYGNFISSVTNESYIGYLMDWVKVKAAHGLGSYRVVSDALTIFGGPATRSIRFAFCLMNWNAEQADGTARLEWYHSGIVGDAENDTKVIDYTDLNFYQQIRLVNNSKLKWTGATQEENGNWLENGEILDISRKQNPTLSLTVGNAPIEIHEVILYDCLMADLIQITDYNNVNFLRGGKSYFQKNVKFAGGYPIEDLGQTQLVSVEVELIAGINNHNKQTC